MSMFDLFKAAPPEPRRRIFLALLLGASLALLAPDALAKDGDSGGGNSGSGSDNSGKGNDNDDNDNDNDDHEDDDDEDDALQHVSSGDAAPLSSIMKEVRKKVPGKVLKVRLRRRLGILVYDLTVLSTTGSYYAVAVNARTQAIIAVREK
jgi:Centromere protein B dimerisation domain